MDNKRVVVQKIRKDYDSALDVAIKYYTILDILNDLELMPREIELLAFTAVRGNISSGGKKEEFCRIFGSSNACIGNMVWQLGKRKLLVKNEDRRIVINPAIALDFIGDVILQLTLIHDSR